MKAKRTNSFVAVTMALAIAGCQEAPTSPSAADLEPSLSFTNGPDSPGNSGVIRFEDAFGFLTWEWDGLFAFHYENADLPFCGGDGVDPTEEFQIVPTPASVVRDLIKTKDTPISIYSAADVLPVLLGGVSPEEGCRIIAEDWLYRGTHTMTITGLIGGGQSFGWNGHGDVFDPSGDQFRYSERATYVAEGEGFVEKVFDINVRPRGRN